MSQYLAISAKARGITLIELVVVIAIIALLATIAIPAYTSYTRKATRSDAMNSLGAVQVAQERWRLSHTSYAINIASIDLSEGYSQLPNAGTSFQGKYNLSMIAAGTTTFSAKAVPNGSQANDTCGSFAINQDGPYYTGYANAACWRR